MSVTSKTKDFDSPVGPVITHDEGTVQNVHVGYNVQLTKNRSLMSILGMTLAIAAIPYGIGGPLISAIYGGGQLSMFVGLLVVLFFDGCVAISLAELASRYPTSSGVYYWSYRLCGKHEKMRKILSFLTGWFWLIGNWTITLSVNFGFASLIAATVSIYNPDWVASSWELLLIFYAICAVVFLICSLGDKLLPYVDTMAAVCNFVTIIAILVAVSVRAKQGRHSASYALGNYDSSFSGWGTGFTFFIGLLPPAYTFSAIGMVTSMTEECAQPEVEVSRAIALTIPFGGIAALLFVLPLCFTLPPLEEILNAPYGQALPYVLNLIMGSQTGALILMIMILFVVLFCSIGITTAASRCTWAFSRDDALPLANVWTRTIADRPVFALALVTIIEMLLGLINLGSSSAFTAFASVGVIALAIGYLVPISISLFAGRTEVSRAKWTCGPVIGTAANIGAIVWILFELVLFSMPTALPVTEISMNYASVVLVGFAALSAAWYAITGRKKFCGPPDEVIEVY
ncbi:amino acid/polyamine transporter I [Paraphoma chrysanthemicola]|uniref:Amino acid/polyamine transporter I n=1 Tax=Paraphoma chrysanthemicola TaxID=798071 RepID=A0A8K0RJB0_9PLEO|nr:amino acid/polyamine transporter I [Paraphoma chrysanthemicola]